MARRKWGVARVRVGLTLLLPRHTLRGSQDPRRFRLRCFAYRRHRGLWTSLSGLLARWKAGAGAGESGPRNCGLASAGLPLNLLPPLASSRPSVAPAALAPAILGQISRSRSRAPARPQRGEP